MLDTCIQDNLLKSVLDFEVVIANKKNTHTKNKPNKNRKRD